MWIQIFRSIFAMLIALATGRSAYALTPPLDNYNVSNGYFDCGLKCYHTADDLHVNQDPNVETEVRAIADGIVVHTNWKATPHGYGGRVIIQHNGFNSLSGHLGKITDDPATSDIFVRVGDHVREGQIIGRLGDRNENGNWVKHLHLAVQPGTYVENQSICGLWDHMGYIPAWTTENPCFCEVFDTWVDPGEFLGIIDHRIGITVKQLGPLSGTPGTQFTWELTASQQQDAPLSTSVIVRNPSGRESTYPMSYVPPRNGDIANFSHAETLQSEGEYSYHFRAGTCSDVVEDEWHAGPTVQQLVGPPAPPPDPICTPTPEVCDDVDNDCDGTKDSYWTSCSGACGNGQKRCVAGQWGGCITPRTPTPEICDNMDNDCDARVDGFNEACSTICGNGQKLCTRGQWGACNARTPTPEVCDNIDNNCDGRVDAFSEACTNACGYQGTKTCAAGQWSVCVVPEVCDGLDNDCSLRVDDNIAPRGCNTLFCNGVHVMSDQRCVNGAWTPCPLQCPCMPVAETCNNVNDDCDQLIDENLTRPCTNECGNSGTQTCSAGNWLSCNAAACPVAPPPPPPVSEPPAPNCAAEICNNLDDDCDRTVDEDVSRPCSNECGNSGTQSCNAGVWLSCNAAACPVAPPPPPPVADRVPLTSPSDASTREVLVGSDPRITLDWEPVANATNYRYEVSYANTNSVVAQGETAETRYILNLPASTIGTQLAWRVQGFNAGGAGPWNTKWTFIFSYHVGSYIQCTSADCPAPNAMYKISSDTRIVADTPIQYIIYYVNAACAVGHSATGVAYDRMRGYLRSAQYNGCPP